MVASFNRVFLIGNLTRDPELRFLPSGQAVANFTVATNRSFVSNSGERKEEVSFVRVVTWARTAETCNEYLKKGSPVFVEGRLQSRSWEAGDGTKRSTLEVIAQSVQFLGRPAKAAPEGGGLPEETITEAAPESKGTEIKVSEEELSPDNEVPF